MYVGLVGPSACTLSIVFARRSGSVAVGQSWVSFLDLAGAEWMLPPAGGFVSPICSSRLVIYPKKYPISIDNLDMDTPFGLDISAYPNRSISMDYLK